MKLEDAFNLATEILDDVAPFLPDAVTKPVRVIGMLIKDASEAEHVLTDGGVVQALHQAAGKSADLNSRLPGLRKDIELELVTLERGDTTTSDAIEVIMAAVVRRFR